ncbi:MAG: LysM peptidoglycan-binding domain-containing protein [Syntrophales bacterium]
MINCRWIGAFINTSVILGFIFVFSGCAAQPTKTADVEQRVAAEQRAGEPAQEVKPSAPTERRAVGKKEDRAAKESEKQETVVCLCEQYTVRKGDSLWWIAKYKDIYNDPFLWPIIYEANREIIKNPKLLYPGQELGIPREGYVLEEIKSIRKKAGAAKPYLPSRQANLPVD